MFCCVVSHLLRVEPCYSRVLTEGQMCASLSSRMSHVMKDCRIYVCALGFPGIKGIAMRVKRILGRATLVFKGGLNHVRSRHRVRASLVLKAQAPTHMLKALLPWYLRVSGNCLSYEHQRFINVCVQVALTILCHVISPGI